MWQNILLVLSVLIFKVQCTNKRPNILIIVADDLGWGDVSFHGSKQIYTPNIDALALDGITFSNYYVSPICSPSRSALLTGRHPIHTGMQHNVINAASPWGVPLRFKMLPQYLKELGYNTHLVGKWHQGHHKVEYLPTNRGFDTHFGYRHGKGDYFDHTDLENFWGYDFWRESTPVHNDYIGEYSTTVYKEEVKKLVRQYHNSSNSFFILFALQSVHAGNSYSVLQAPQEYINRFPHIKDHRRRTFAGMLSAMDDAVGEIFEELSTGDAINNTIIMFTTDNGGATGGSRFRVDNSVGSNWPLRGVKYTLWEGGVKGVCFLWSRLLNNTSYVYHDLMHIQDWLPTLYSAVGGNRRSLPPDLDGIDFWDTLSNAKRSEPLRTEVLHNIDDKLNIYALRYNDYKIVYGTVYNGTLDGWFRPLGFHERHNFTSGGIVNKILNKRSSKLAHRNQLKIKCGEKPVNASSNCRPKEEACLFNIKLDPCEYNNIASEQAEIIKFLMQKIFAYNKTAIAPNNKPRDPRSNPVFHHYTWDVWQ